MFPQSTPSAPHWHRIIHDLHTTEANLNFWKQILDQGSHSRFHLLSMGPAAFARDVMTAARPLLGLQAAGDTESKPPKVQGMTATLQIQHRIQVLGELRVHLAAALAQVHTGAACLRLRAAQRLTGMSSVGMLREHACDTLRAVLDDVVQCSDSVMDVLWGLSEATQGLLLSQGAFVVGDVRSSSGSGGQKGSPDQAVHGAMAAALHGLAPPRDTAPLLPGQPDLAVALRSARRAASRAGPLVGLPAWLAMPSRMQRYWFTYCLRGAAAAYCALYLVRHSSLMGSEDLQRWGNTIVV